MKNKIIKFVTVTSLCLMASNAWSDCNWVGKVVRLRLGVNGNNFVDVAEDKGFPLKFAFFNVPNANYYPLLSGTQAGHLKVVITGDASTCLNTSIPQFSNGGALKLVDVYTNW